MRLTPNDALSAGPLVVEDPFGQGWKFHCVRATAHKFQPWVLAAMSIAARAKGLRALAAAETKSVELATENSASILAGMDEDSLQMLDQVTRFYAAIEEAGSREPDDVAGLVFNWEGVEDEGEPVPFSPDALRSLLSDAKVGEVNLAVMNGDGPAILEAGTFAGLTVGQALCIWIPREIRNRSHQEQVEIAKKKAPSGDAPSFGAGSGTAAKKRKSRRTKAGSS